jgi:hypothetical protein
VRLHLYVRGLSPEEAFRGSGDNLALSPTLATPVETPFSFATWLPLFVVDHFLFLLVFCSDVTCCIAQRRAAAGFAPRAVNAGRICTAGKPFAAYESTCTHYPILIDSPKVALIWPCCSSEIFRFRTTLLNRNDYCSESKYFGRASAGSKWVKMRTKRVKICFLHRIVLWVQLICSPLLESLWN